jgi:hypothetical protein
VAVSNEKFYLWNTKKLILAPPRQLFACFPLE